MSDLAYSLRLFWMDREVWFELWAVLLATYAPAIVIAVAASLLSACAGMRGFYPALGVAAWCVVLIVSTGAESAGQVGLEVALGLPWWVVPSAAAALRQGGFVLAVGLLVLSMPRAASPPDDADGFSAE